MPPAFRIPCNIVCVDRPGWSEGPEPGADMSGSVRNVLQRPAQDELARSEAPRKALTSRTCTDMAAKKIVVDVVSDTV